MFCDGIPLCEITKYLSDKSFADFRMVNKYVFNILRNESSKRLVKARIRYEEKKKRREEQMLKLEKEKMEWIRRNRYNNPDDNDKYNVVPYSGKFGGVYSFNDDNKYKKY